MKKISFLPALLVVTMIFTSCGEDENSSDTMFTASISGTAEILESSGTANVTILLDKQNDSGKDVTIPYELSGTATAEEDFTSPSGSVTLSTGETQATVNISLIDDAAEEEDETIIITVKSTADVGVASDASATLTILANDKGLPLTGKIDGNSWTFKIGTAKLEALDDNLVLELMGQDFDDEFDPCDAIVNSRARIKFIVPNKVGDYSQPRDVSSQSVGFFPAVNGGKLQRATSGTVQIKSITTSEVTGYVDAKADDNNFVTGDFTAKRCN